MKKWWVASLLAFPITGIFGGHHLYLGNYRKFVGYTFMWFYFFLLSYKDYADIDISIPRFLQDSMGFVFLFGFLVFPIYNFFGYAFFGIIKVNKVDYHIRGKKAEKWDEKIEEWLLWPMHNHFWNDSWCKDSYYWSGTDEIQKVPTKPRATRKSKPKTTTKTQTKKRSAPVNSKNKKFNNTIEAIRNDIKAKIEDNSKNRISDNYNAIKINNIVSKDIVLEK